LGTGRRRLPEKAAPALSASMRGKDEPCLSRAAVLAVLAM
jgi:hypothetical protein